MSTSETKSIPSWEPMTPEEIEAERMANRVLFDAFLDKLETETPSQLVAGIREHDSVCRAAQVALTVGLFKHRGAPKALAGAILSDRGCYDLETKHEADMMDAGQRQRVYMIRKALGKAIYDLSESSYDLFCRALHYGDYAAAADILEGNAR